MDREAIVSRLVTRGLGRELLLLDEVDSTNALAARMLAEGRLSDGMAIIAGRQTAGKGRFNRAWHSAGGLCLSVAVGAEGQAHALGPVTLAAGVAVARGLAAACGGGFFLKYPNDIFSAKRDGKKVGGILAELKPRGEGKPPMLIIGVGINVEQEFFPEKLAETAVSLRQLGFSASREEVAAAALNSLERQLDEFKNGGLAALLGQWREMDCTLGRKVSVKNISSAVEGVARGIGDDGALLVETADGMRRVTAGDILWGNGSDASCD
jgi:BirA family biotin operon repressor/biotin-[acetyl-CoA-carboxylase] ligase